MEGAGVDIVLLEQRNVSIGLRRTRRGTGTTERKISQAPLRSTHNQTPTYLWLLPSSGTSSGVLGQSSTLWDEVCNASFTAATKVSMLKSVGNSMTSSLGSTPHASTAGNMKILDGFIIIEGLMRILWSGIRNLARLRDHLLWEVLVKRDKMMVVKRRAR